MVIKIGVTNGTMILDPHTQVNPCARLTMAINDAGYSPKAQSLRRSVPSGENVLKPDASFVGRRCYRSSFHLHYMISSVIKLWTALLPGKGRVALCSGSPTRLLAGVLRPREVCPRKVDSRPGRNLERYPTESGLGLALPLLEALAKARGLRISLERKLF
ncbi:hypothetical protein BAUCODRAFT_268725 [Baudoinia panamericana UAMH 10762]|uniref:Uncharacterized protein n=1 Tax=Baudoinia panamericana (strain UAMH 10762) TaxID=717646 RepID=M2MNE1_BAUPA|nr:uncharacterized protein BAUCODRAFT_268725 [Baudoinia panamericana UAMH 10762]EMC92963.1 hypothetical protein BAUCODRAFT_268725 [Baudoinia panamericana UAMH 10762]